MLYRKIKTKIQEWIINGKQPLLIDGARQVGKTTIIRDSLKSVDFVEFNLVQEPEFLSMLNDIDKISPDELLTLLKIYSKKKLTKGKTIIFIDEIQECKELVTKVKFLLEEGSFKYIFSGSLLGVELNNLRSAPVGYLHTETMYPLDLEEFLINSGIEEDIFKILNTSFNNLVPVNKSIHEQILKKFREYLVIGGMPEAVYSFVNEHDYNKVFNIHKNIIKTYKLDFTKYESQSNNLHLKASFENIPAELNSQNKRYIIKNLDSARHYKRIEETFEWHNAAGVAIPVYNCTEPQSPLVLSKKSNLFKLFLNDVGLLSNMFGKSCILNILNNKANVNFGALYENFVAQELNTHGYNCYYFNSKKFGELDFLIETDKILPIEVKSGANYTKHTALNNIMSNKTFDIEKAIVFSNENVSCCDVATMYKETKEFKIKDNYKVCYLPIYMTMFLNYEAIDLNQVE